MMNKILLLVFITIIGGCALFTKKQVSYQNICHMLDDNVSWYKGLKYVEKEYDVEMSTILAFIKQESSFDANARPPYNKIFNIIPTGRTSSSYGFSQAKDTTWEWYQQKTGNVNHKRNDFSHSAEFIAWYINTSYQLNKIRTTDVYNQYLAYHEGHGGFSNSSYKSKPWLLSVANKVKDTATSYKYSLNKCREQLDNNYEWSLF